MPKSVHIFAIAVLFFLTVQYGHAQFKIKLSEVKKIELVTAGGGLSDQGNLLEIINRDGVWKCYKPNIFNIQKSTGIISYTEPTFIKEINTAILQRLLNCLANADSVIHLKQFNIDTAELIRGFDSMKVNLKPELKVKMAKAVRNENTLYKAVYQLLRPRPWDDADYYAFKITTKTNITYTIEANSFANIYDLPWTVGGVKCYDPEISLIFNEITGNSDYPNYKKKNFYNSINRLIYRDNF